MAKRRRVSDAENARLRSLPLCYVLDALELYWKKDTTYAPRGNKSSVRIHLTVANAVREIIITGPKFYDTHDARFAGGCAIDLVEKVMSCDYLHAVALLRPIYAGYAGDLLTRSMPASVAMPKAERPQQVANDPWKKASMLVQAVTSRPPLPQRDQSAEKAETEVRRVPNPMQLPLRPVPEATPVKVEKPKPQPSPKSASPQRIREQLELYREVIKSVSHEQKAYYQTKIEELEKALSSNSDF